uniref:Uncharacterized protein n=1 Tax=viral metagenome TaxID=1070528 RepID=A0A6C0DVX5_9ZZZZ
MLTNFDVKDDIYIYIIYNTFTLFHLHYFILIPK